MTRDEVKDIIRKYTKTHPSYFKGKTDEDLTDMVNEWYAAFNGVPADIMQKAVELRAKKSPYVPTVAEMQSTLKGLYYHALAMVSFLSATNTENDEEPFYTNLRIVQALRRCLEV